MQTNCVVLVPYTRHIEPPCEAGLAALERAGYTVRRAPGFSQIDYARCQLASDALRDGFDELICIDSDIAFDPRDVLRLREHNLPLVCGLYPRKGPKGFACEFLPGTRGLVFGPQGGLKEIRYAGLGFLLSRRVVYETVQSRFQLPECNPSQGRFLVPYFLPMLHTDPADATLTRYLAEDYAFLERARQAGFPLLADTTIRLGHIGTFAYRWDRF